ncbi:MFS transporter [Kiloniella laminariae]|uniref:MFS transporter n=1 Tax=Kiloniella laminariae TaxID=454162 RepID=A0ABT4LIV8_9PROT|nr:MFS transporter [Kiloniella laminariae]MCZ4281049.1 MFS transporter [Kiloniella laminariae]
MMMFSAVSKSWALFLGLAFLMLGNGLQSTVLSVRASMEGFSTETTGFVMACYFIGYFMGSFAAPKALETVGHVRVFAALASLSSTSALLHAVFIDPYVWGAMRFITGFCFAGLYIVAESWLNHSATNETRGKLLSIYMVVLYGFLALGQLLINVSDPGSFVPFVLMSVLVSLALLPTTMTAVQAPVFESPTPVSLKRLYQISPLGFACAFGVGLAQAQIFGIGAIYGGKLQMTPQDISFFMAAMSVGGIALQWPIGKLSDRFDRRQVLIVVSVLAAIVGLSLVPLSGPQASVLFLISAFIFGALCMPLYSLAIAHTNDHLETSEIVAATSGLIVIGGFGAMIGPLVSPLLMGRFGPDAFVYSLSFTLLLIGLFGIYRMTRRSAVPLGDQGDYVGLPMEASSMVVAMTPEGEEWYEEVIAEAEAEATTAANLAESMGVEVESPEMLDDGAALWAKEDDEADNTDQENPPGKKS